MDDNSITKNEEIVGYLKILYTILKDARSTIDLDRLKYVIDILKKDKSRMYPLSQSKMKFKVEEIINVVSKLKDGVAISFEEDELVKNYQKGKSYFTMVSSKNFSDLYSYLQEKGHELAASELIIIYFYLTGQETKIKKKEDILREINSYISQNLYFDNMNNRFTGNIKNDLT